MFSARSWGAVEAAGETALARGRGRETGIYTSRRVGPLSTALGKRELNKFRDNCSRASTLSALKDK